MPSAFRVFRIVFLGGLLLALTAFAVVRWGPVTTAVSVGYLCLAIVHIATLAGIAARMEPAERITAPGWLYTAGFLHTLIALGVAIATAGVQLGRSSGDLVAVR
jgi:hypothetical protein